MSIPARQKSSVWRGKARDGQGPATSSLFRMVRQEMQTASLHRGVVTLMVVCSRTQLSSTVRRGLQELFGRATTVIAMEAMVTSA